MKKLTDYIYIVENIIPESLCDQILSEYDTSNEWENALIGNGVYDPKIRDVYQIRMSTEDAIRGIEKRKDLDQAVFEVVAKGLAKYKEKFTWNTNTSDEGYHLLKYSPGQKYTEHCDFSGTHSSRELTATLSLNDDYEGGEFSILGGEFKQKLPKGSMLFFPSNFLYPHQVLPVTKGTRYSIVTWFV